MVSINAVEEGRRKLQQIVAEQVEEGIRDALGADTASLIERQAARIAELEADRDRLASIVERARNGDHAGGSATIWSLREQRDNCLVRIAELEAELGAACDRSARDTRSVTTGGENASPQFT